MTGTSLDGMDIAVVATEGVGLGMSARLVLHEGHAFDESLRRGLRAAAEQAPTTTGEIAALALAFALFHAHRVAEALRRAGVAADLVAVHGQTVFHSPPVSWQLFQPAPMVELLGVPVVCDLRQADLAAGGQGAPITPIADWILFRSGVDRAVVNLGGFCNMTLLPGGGDVSTVRGADVCACNQVLDAVARVALGRPFDENGAAARSGTVDRGAERRLVETLRRQRDLGRSLGTGDEAMAWVESERGRLRPADLAATAAVAVGQVIGESASGTGRGLGPAAEILLAGGGARHTPLVEAIARAHGGGEGRVRPLDAVGVPVDARESMEMAVLGALAADGVPITLPAVTGRRESRTRDGLWCLPRSVSGLLERPGSADALRIANGNFTTGSPPP